MTRSHLSQRAVATPATNYGAIKDEKGRKKKGKKRKGKEKREIREHYI